MATTDLFEMEDDLNRRRSSGGFPQSQSNEFTMFGPGGGGGDGEDDFGVFPTTTHGSNTNDRRSQASGLQPSDLRIPSGSTGSQSRNNENGSSRENTLFQQQQQLQLQQTLNRTTQLPAEFDDDVDFDDEQTWQYTMAEDFSHPTPQKQSQLQSQNNNTNNKGTRRGSAGNGGNGINHSNNNNSKSNSQAKSSQQQQQQQQTDLFHRMNGSMPNMAYHPPAPPIPSATTTPSSTAAAAAASGGARQTSFRDLVDQKRLFSHHGELNDAGAGASNPKNNGNNKNGSSVRNSNLPPHPPPLPFKHSINHLPPHIPSSKPRLPPSGSSNSSNNNKSPPWRPPQPQQQQQQQTIQPHFATHSFANTHAALSKDCLDADTVVFNAALQDDDNKTFATRDDITWAINMVGSEDSDDDDDDYNDNNNENDNKHHRISLPTTTTTTAAAAAAQKYEDDGGYTECGDVTLPTLFSNSTGATVSSKMSASSSGTSSKFFPPLSPHHSSPPLPPRGAPPPAAPAATASKDIEFVPFGAPSPPSTCSPAAALVPAAATVVHDESVFDESDFAFGKALPNVLRSSTSSSASSPPEDFHEFAAFSSAPTATDDASVVSKHSTTTPSFASFVAVAVGEEGPLANTSHSNNSNKVERHHSLATSIASPRSNKLPKDLARERPSSCGSIGSGKEQSNHNNSNSNNNNRKGEIPLSPAQHLGAPPRAKSIGGSGLSSSTSTSFATPRKRSVSAKLPSKSVLELMHRSSIDFGTLQRQPFDLFHQDSNNKQHSRSDDDVMAQFHQSSGQLLFESKIDVGGFAKFPTADPPQASNVKYYEDIPLSGPLIRGSSSGGDAPDAGRYSPTKVQSPRKVNIPDKKLQQQQFAATPEQGAKRHVPIILDHENMPRLSLTEYPDEAQAVRRTPTSRPKPSVVGRDGSNSNSNARSTSSPRKPSRSRPSSSTSSNNASIITPSSGKKKTVDGLDLPLMDSPLTSSAVPRRKGVDPMTDGWNGSFACDNFAATTTTCEGRETNRHRSSSTRESTRDGSSADRRRTSSIGKRQAAATTATATTRRSKSGQSSGTPATTAT